MAYRDEVVDAPIVVAAFGSRVFGLSAVNGERVWRYEGLRQTQAALVRLALDRGRVYVASGRLLACLDHASGEELWWAALEAGGGTLLASGGRVFVGGDGTLTCFDENGQKLWHDGFKGMGLGAVAIALPGCAAQADA